MPYSPTVSSSPRAAGDGASQQVAHTSAASSSGRSRRSRRSGSSASRRRPRRAVDGTQKHYGPHLCRFPPFRPPAAVMLDPFPNVRINALCMAGLSSLVTVHRSGVRLFRERQLSAVGGSHGVGAAMASSSSMSSLYPFLPISPVTSTPSQRSTPMPTAAAGAAAQLSAGAAASGVFELVETRSDFQIRESYLCAAMQPVLMDDAVLLSKWSRYFCVASGNDRVVHSVAVMSSGAHFCLHHEKHQGNKVVAMHCTQMATEPFHPTVLRPAVVSVDEIGGVVLFDVEREVAVALEKAPLWFRQADKAKGSGAAAKAPGLPEQPKSLLGQQLSPDEEDHVVDAMERVPVKERAAYHLDHGVATRVALVGPCLELCNRCRNAFMGLQTSRGYTVVSVYVCSRAQDVMPASESAQAHHSSGSHNAAAAAGPAAELDVTLLRVLWGHRRAFVMEEIRLVRETAPTDVCEAGVALAARPYQVALPMTLLLARPALELWQLCACTGERIDTRGLYRRNYTAGKAKGGASAAVTRSRAASEFIIHWVPLGRHQLTVMQDERVGPQSWYCIAAVTDDDTVLLLGREPQSCRTPSPFKTAKARFPAEAVASAPPSPSKPVAASAGASAPSLVAAAMDALRSEGGGEGEKFRDADLEGWLDDLNTSPNPSPAAEGATTPDAGKKADKPEEAKVVITLDSESTTHPYTLLMELYSAKRAAAGDMSGDGASTSAAAGALTVMPDLRHNRLLLFRGDDDALLSVALPFLGSMPTITDEEQVSETPEVSVGAPARAAPAVATPVPAPAAADSGKAADAGGYSQLLWGATSKAVTVASLGWSSSMQKWAPTSSSYFSFNGGAGSGATAPPAPTPSTAAAHTPPPATVEAASSSSPVATSSAGHSPKSAEREAASRPAAESYHRPFSLTRPLMAAMFHFAGDDTAASTEVFSKSTTVPAIAVSTPRQQMAAPSAAQAGEALGSGSLRSSAPPAAALQVPLRSNEQSFHSLDLRSPSEASTSRTAASLALPIRVARSERERSASPVLSISSRPRRHRQRSAASVAADGDESRLGGDDEDVGESRSRREKGRRSGKARERVATVTLAAPQAVAVDDGTAQASYMQQQMQLLTQEEEEEDDDNQQPLTTAAKPERGSKGAAKTAQLFRTPEELQYALRRLVDVEEPEARNAMLYSWRDGHNELYIRLSVEQDRLVDAAAARRGIRHRSVPHLHDVALRVATNTSADVADGVHSVGFLSAYHSAAAWRADTASYGHCFCFADYFATLQVTQQLCDLQERDKCRLELEDLRLQQARDLAAVHPFEWMTVWQNEERRAGEAGWRLHATFPYDDEKEGRVVDLHWLNRTAGSVTGTGAAAEWRWATEKETRLYAEEEEAKVVNTTNNSSSSKTTLSKLRVRSLVKEQKDWAVGPWEYAERWPSRTDNAKARGDGSSPWSGSETAAHRCRRRRLSRLRVNVEEQRRLQELTEAHIREIGALRDELGL